MIRGLVFFVFVALLFSACAVQHPKYFMVEKVMQAELGMSKDTVDSIFGLPPYNLRSIDTAGFITYTYVYRTRHIKRFPIVMSRKRGLVVEGQFVDLNVTYSPEGKVVSIENCTDCPESYLTETKINPGEIIVSITTIITVTVPALLVYLSSL